MSQQNVEVVRTAIHAWNSDDQDALLACFDPELEWQTAMATAIEGAPDVNHGHEGARQVWRRYRELFDEIRVEEPHFLDLGDRVLTLSYMKVKGRGSSIELREELAQVMTIKEGRIVRSEDFRSHAEGRRAAGLPEQDALTS
jgi:ketosteroid isomerase-like protein